MSKSDLLNQYLEDMFGVFVLCDLKFNSLGHLNQQEKKVILAKNPWQWKIPANYFSGAEPFIEDLLDGNRDFLPPSDIHPKDFNQWDYDISIILNSKAPLGEAEIRDLNEKQIEELKSNILYHVYRVKKVPSSLFVKLIKKIPFPNTYAIEASWANFYRNGTYDACRVYCAYINNKWTTFASPDPIRDQDRDYTYDDKFKLAMSAWFNRFFEWSVSFESSDSNAFNLRFPTDPQGAKEVFRLRDIPNGNSRRKALMHWVGEHWRKQRVDKTEEIKIRNYLRGQETFIWNGLKVTIKPSPTDENRLAELKEMPKERRKLSLVG